MLSCFVGGDGLTVLSIIIPLGTFQAQTRETGREQNPSHSNLLTGGRKLLPSCVVPRKPCHL